MRFLFLFLLVLSTSPVAAATATAGQPPTVPKRGYGGTSTIDELSSKAPAAREAPKEWLQEGACPFECCQYGTWTARHTLIVLASPTHGARSVADIAPGTTFIAVTGHTRTIAGLFRFSRPVGRFAAGDRVSVYDYLGEGFYRAWAGSGMQEIELLAAAPGVVHAPASTGSWEREPVQTWWVKVHLPSGVEGWIEMNDPTAVDGNDACG